MFVDLSQGTVTLPNFIVIKMFNFYGNKVVNKI